MLAMIEVVSDATLKEVAEDEAEQDEAELERA
jgi:hypothetical protein